jgi:hypothetical protein
MQPLHALLKFFKSECFNGILVPAAMAYLHSTVTGWFALGTGLMLCYLCSNHGSWLDRIIAKTRYLFWALMAVFGILIGTLDNTRASVGTAFLAGFALVVLAEGLTQRGDSRAKWVGFGLMLSLWTLTYFLK